MTSLLLDSEALEATVTSVSVAWLEPRAETDETEPETGWIFSEAGDDVGGSRVKKRRSDVMVVGGGKKAEGETEVATSAKSGRKVCQKHTFN